MKKKMGNNNRLHLTPIHFQLAQEDCMKAKFQIWICS